MVEAIRAGDIPGVQLKVRGGLSLDQPSAWDWLTDETRLQSWLAERVRVQGPPSPGASLRLESPASELVETGETLVLDPPSRWVLSFRKLDSGWQQATRLTLAVRAEAQGSEIVVFHEGFERLSLSLCLTAWEEYRKRWRAALDRLQQAVGAA